MLAPGTSLPMVTVVDVASREADDAPRADLAALGDARPAAVDFGFDGEALDPLAERHELAEGNDVDRLRMGETGFDGCVRGAVVGRPIGVGLVVESAGDRELGVVAASRASGHVSLASKVEAENGVECGAELAKSIGIVVGKESAPIGRDAKQKVVALADGGKPEVD